VAEQPGQELGRGLEQVTASRSEPGADQERSVAELAVAVDDLTDLFRRRLYEDKVRARALDLLQSEVEFARTGLQTTFVLPMVRELLLVVDRGYASEDELGESLADEVLEVLRRRGLEVLDTAGSFDPAVHEAVGTVDAEGLTVGAVAAVRRPGYRMHEHLVRPAQVVVTAERVEPDHAAP
jgi:molecular chaperone GrpE